MADDLIQHYIDKPSFSSDTEFAKAQLADLLAAYQKVKEARANLGPATGTANIVSGAQEATKAVKEMTAAVTAQGQVIGQTVQIYNAQNNSLQNNIRNLNDYKKALKDNSDLQKQTIKDFESGAISSDEYRQKMATLTEAQFKLKQAVSDTTKEIKLQTLLNTAPPTSILEAQTQNKQLTAQVIRTPTTDTEAIAKLNALIDRNNQLIDENSDKLARQKINIGNYGPSVKAALSIVEDELVKINAQLAVTDKDSAAFDVLTKQANLLKSVSTGLDKSFDSTRTELRALEEAAKKVGSEFGITSEQFQKLSAEIGERKDQLKDIQGAINFQASDTRNLDAIVGAVQAVTGAYGAYQSAVVLTGVSDEELQKTMVKLQAALTLVTSVQAVANSLQGESALIQGVLAAKATLLASAQKIVAIASGQSAVALQAQSVASQEAAVSTAELAAAQTAAATGGEAIAASSVQGAVGMEAESVAAGTLAGTLDTVAVSEGAVTTGAISMATAIAATGIGLLIIGLAIAVYKVVEAVRDWNEENVSIKKANEDVVVTMRDLINATKEYESIRKLASQQELTDLQNKIDRQKELGVTSAQSLALDLKVAQQNAKNAKEEVDRLGVTKERLALARKQTEEAANSLRIEQQFKEEFEQNSSEKGNKDYDKIVKSYDDRIKIYQNDYDAKKANLDLGLEAFTNNEVAQQKIQSISNNTIKLSLDDRRKFIQESAKIEVDIATAKNNKILNSEYSTLDERLAALKSNLALQKKAIEADNQAVQSDPTVSGVDKLLATKTANANILKAETESQQTITKLKEDYRLKDLAAEAEIQKSIYNTVVQTNSDIANNDALTESQRLAALKKSIEARKAVLDTQFNTDLSSAGITDPEIERIKQEGFFEIKNKKITDAELKKLIADYNASVISLSKDSNTERIKIVKDYYEQYAYESDKALRKVQRENDADANSLEDVYNKDIIDLNNSYAQGLMSTEKYNQQRLKLDDDYAKKSIQIQIENIEKTLSASESAAEVEKKLQKELNDLKSQDTSKLTDDEQKVHDDRIKQVTDELTKIQDAVGKESDLYKQLSKLKKDLSEADKKIDDDVKKSTLDRLNDIKEYAEGILNVMSAAINYSVTSQKNALQAQSDQVEKNSQRELELINASGLAEEQKAAKITILNARTQAQKDLIAQKQKQADQQQAQAQKAQTIFSIILSTAEAVVKALPDIPLSIFSAVVGAAELAIAIATPVPKFKDGKNNDYQGPAIVGDGGVPEIIQRADGSIELTPAKDTLTYLGRYDKVFPDFMNFMRSNATPRIKSFSTENNKFEQAVENQTKILKPILSKIANKRDLQLGATDRGMIAIWKHGASSTKYLDENTNW